MMRKLMCGVALAACAIGCAPTEPTTREGAVPGFRAPVARPVGTIFSSVYERSPDAVRTGSGRPGPAYWQNEADYAIDAELDPASNTVRAALRVRYTNNSPHDLAYLWFNLEQNLFKRGSAGDLKFGQGQRFGNRDGIDGGFDIQRVRLVEGASGGASDADVRELRSMRAGAALEMREHGTLGRVDLPEVLGSGESVTIEIVFEFQVPPNGSDRMGREDVADGRIFQLAQWFPNVCRFDDFEGWNTLEYFGRGEFYTDFGDYDVRIRVPGDHVVGATGVLTNPAAVMGGASLAAWRRAHDGDADPSSIVIRSLDQAADATGELPPRTWHFRAERVRNFSWAASDAFAWEAMGVDVPTVVGDVIEPTDDDKARAAGVHGSDSMGGVNDPIPEGVPTRLVVVHSFYPREAAGQWVRSNEYQAFTLRLHSRMWFPYPYPQSTNVNGIVGGMEYPMIAFCRNRTSPRGLFGVTDHELVHNWFPMIVNSNERRRAWMDEGFTTFLGIYAGKYFYPDQTPWAITRFFERLNTPDVPPVDTQPDYMPPGRLGFLAYRKTAFGLWLLREHILGADRFDPAFREYIRVWAFKSPGPEDFFRLMDEAAGADLSWFWRGWFLESTQLDQAITGVAADADGSWRVVFENRGDMVMPLFVTLRFAGGEEAAIRYPVSVWAASDVFEASIDPGERRLVGVELDAVGALPDVDRANNRWRR